ncbi:hypothetical protein THAOC_02232 [Thalassiosira oceanica]|uniref:Helicase ATP-binding domain-containing protein n=1 Tax=Thalassiosira oceanica TaxID=159749 RepID=K0TMA2_THAOC|nr:hypothetical protein THAOC_02232 [Thalassiosira oceanica]|eukprot:EJK76026.1 hypothetical protein THAOC_02232 [Thalassiosira oceanica]
MRQDSGLAPLKSMEEERFDADKARARREERRARRRKRLRAALGIDSSDEDAEFDGKTKKKDAKKMPSILGKKGKKGPRRTTGRVRFDDDDSAAVAQAVKTERNYTKVFCPICQTILTVNDNDDGTPDEVLARHIQSCQASSRTRNGSRTLRKRRKPSVVDLDSDEDSDIEAEVLVERGDLEDTKNSRIPTRLEAPTSIDDLDEFDYEDRIDFWVANGLGLMGSMSERDKSEVPPGSVVYDEQLEVPAWMNDRLFPYQRTGVRWMWELYRQGAGGVVGDEVRQCSVLRSHQNTFFLTATTTQKMGLGKTVQVCSFLGSMCSNRMLGSVLIVAPATMLTHWLRELAVWAPGLRRVIVHKSGEADGVARVVSKGMLRSLQRWLKKAREDRVNEPIDEDDFRNPSNPEHMFCGVGYAVVTTYDNIRRSQDEWTGHNWSYVVLDEGQKIRNPDSEVTLACKRLRTPNRLLLSGTPIQNDLKELWSLFDFIFPGRLGTLPAFEAEFAAPIKRGGYSNASPMQVQLAYRCSLVLRDLINPYLLRRQKKDIKEVSRMPGKTEQVLFCRLTSKQRSLYEDYIRSDEVLSVVRGNTQLLKAVTVLRKICNHPDLISGPNGADFNGGESSSDSEDEDYMDMERLAERSGKLQVLAKIRPASSSSSSSTLLALASRPRLFGGPGMAAVFHGSLRSGQSTRPGLRSNKERTESESRASQQRIKMVVAQNNNNGNPYHALANLGGTNAQVISGQTNQSGDGLRVNFDSNTTVQEVAGRISMLVDGVINAIDNLNNNGGTTSVAVTVGGTTTHVTRNNMFRFIRLLLLLCQIHDHLIANANLYARGLWYFYSHYLGKDNVSQEQFSDDMIQLSTSLSVPLQGLNVKERKNTWIFGSAVLKIEYRDGVVREVDLSLDDHGWLGGDEPISSDMNTGNIKSVTASSKTCNGIIRVIVVEKHCIFQQLCANGFDKTIKAILICSGGYPSKNTKAWLSFLKAAFSVRDGNCGVVHDLNPCGYALGHAFSTNKFPGYNAYITDVRVIGLQTRVM